MNIKLDASHQCVLEHWETINRMKECAAQVEKHLEECARKVCHSKQKGHFERGDWIEKWGEFAMNPARLQKWKNSGESLLALGIENISVESLLQQNNASPCSSYVYSPYRHDKTIHDTSTDQLNSLVPPPPGFEQTFDIPGRGYVFRRILPALTPEDICNPANLEQYFTDPLVTLIEWYEAHENTILKAFGESRHAKI